MATFKEGYMGAFSGKLGTAIGYMWKGRPCLRSHQPRPKNPHTKEQVHNRKVFGTASRLAADMADATGIGLRGIAAERNTSVHNVFVSLNRHCIGVTEGETTVDFTALRVAEGELPGVAFSTLQHVGAGEIAVDYERTGNEGSYGDYVYLYAYVPELGYGALSLPAARGGDRVCLHLSERWRGREAHIYGFVWDHESTASRSTYIGETTL